MCINTVVLIVNIFELKDDLKQKGPSGIALAGTTALEKPGCLLWVGRVSPPFEEADLGRISLFRRRISVSQTGQKRTFALTDFSTSDWYGLQGAGQWGAYLGIIERPDAQGRIQN